MNIDLEDVLLRAHAISYVRGPECDYDAEMTCECGWNGAPRDYGKHLLVTLGLEERVLTDWRLELSRPPLVFYSTKPFGAATAPTTGVETHPLQDREFLNMYRGPKDRIAMSKAERKEYNNLWRARE